MLTRLQYRGGFSLAFARHKLTLRGDPIGPMADEPNVAAETTDYEHLLGHTRLTLSDLIAISGAPLSPRMRAMADRGAYRLLLILTNMRLGVWMPHPEVVRRARSYLDMPPEYRQKDRWWVRRTWLLLLWYQAPHPWWHRDPWKQQEAMMRQGDRETRLWAHVLELRQRSTEGDSNLLGAFARLRAALCWRMMQPTLALLWAEAVGRTSSRATWIKVSDGDRHDNLGLVEALQRGSRNIMVLDAGGDHPGTWRTVGRAISLARSAGFEINLDPVTTLASDGEPGRGTTPPNDEVTQPWARGTFTWPQYTTMGSPSTATSWCASSAGGRARRRTSGPAQVIIRIIPMKQLSRSCMTAQMSSLTSASARVQSSRRCMISPTATCARHDRLCAHRATLGYLMFAQRYMGRINRMPRICMPRAAFRIWVGPAWIA